MRLISATVRAYRIHTEQSIEFDPALTLIGGPNETGKSTLVEAIHRGLFLKSRVTGEVQKSMASFGIAGSPEVEVSFEAQNTRYTVSKRFSGQSGTTQLTELGGQTWHGEDAEARLLSLLGVEDVGKGRGLADRVAQQWAHLWVWQGLSGSNPAEHAASQHTNLLNRLQEDGGAVALQSETDCQVARRFAEGIENTFTQGANPRPKKGSPLEKAHAAVQEAEAGREACAERVQRLQQAMADFEDARATITRTAESLQNFRLQSAELEKKRQAIIQLRQDEKTQQVEAENASEKYTALSRADAQIKTLRQKIAATTEALAPKKRQLADHEAQCRAVENRVGEASKEQEKADVRLRNVRLRKELAEAIIRRFEKAQAVKELEAQSKEADVVQRRHRELREQSAKLPEIDRKQLQALRKHESELARAQAALGAMAARIEVLEADTGIEAGGVPVAPGNSHIVTEATEVRIGATVRLRIDPGGGQSLAEARRDVHSLRDRLQQTLDQHSVESVEQAADAVVRRTDLLNKLAHAESQLKALSVADLPQKLGEAEEAKSAADSQVERRLEQLEDITLPEDLKAANAWLTESDDALAEAERELLRLKVVHEAAVKEQASVAEALGKVRQSLDTETRQLADLEAQLRLSLENHGDDAERGRALTSALDRKEKATHALEQTRQEMEELQPDLLERNLDRLKRAREQTEQQRQDAEKTKAVAEAALRSDGRENPEAALAMADARLHSAKEHLVSAQRQADANLLLHSLFQQEQRAMAEQFTRPLADKITGYLQCLFGPGAEAKLALAENAVSGIQLVRTSHGGAIDFGELSGGTREQVAAAVRLAIAEVLAADHDLCLPMVFDDAFAYADPQRVQSLQQMLDLAASRGLQIIVLTCNATDYASLGACEIFLKPRAVSLAGIRDDSSKAV